MPVNRNNRPALGSNRKNNNTSRTTGLSGKAVTRRSAAVSYNFPKKGVVPDVDYESEIVEIFDTKTKAGAMAVDVHYDLKDQRGRILHVKLRYPDGSFYFDELCSALLAAGHPEGAPLSEAVGIRELVRVGYEEGSSLGSFVARKPLDEVEETSASDEDTEFDDFLPDSDDDDEA